MAGVPSEASPSIPDVIASTEGPQAAPAEPQGTVVLEADDLAQAQADVVAQEPSAAPKVLESVTEALGAPSAAVEAISETLADRQVALAIEALANACTQADVAEAASEPPSMATLSAEAVGDAGSLDASETGDEVDLGEAAKIEEDRSEEDPAEVTAIFPTDEVAPEPAVEPVAEPAVEPVAEASPEVVASVAPSLKSRTVYGVTVSAEAQLEAWTQWIQTPGTTMELASVFRGQGFTQRVSSQIAARVVNEEERRGLLRKDPETGIWTLTA